MSDAVPSMHRPPWGASRPVGEMSQVEIAEQLETVTKWIEAERAREREARAAYKLIADDVDSKVKGIRAYATALVNEQTRRLSSFSGLINSPPDRPPPEAGPSDPQSKRTFSTAILEVWALPEFKRPLTTEQIADGLNRVGYVSSAGPRSFKSALNQTLAKLCRSGKILKYRMDGTRIAPEDVESRARRYMELSAARAAGIEP